MGKKDKQPKLGKTQTVSLPKNDNEKKPFVLPWVLLLLGITAFCFYPMLQNGFTNWDDEQYVIDNLLLPGPDWKGIFTQPVASNYHPLTIISFVFNYRISKLSPYSYLLLNYLLHILNTALVFYFIYQISAKKIGVAWLTALIFAIHPMHVESVAWVSERKDVLYTLFFLLALIKYGQYLQTGKKRAYWSCFVLFIFSLLSKPAAIILPLVLMLLDYWKERTFDKKCFLEKIPFLILSVLFAVITFQIQSGTAVQSLERIPLILRPVLGSYVVAIYFFRFFIPYPLSAFHPYPPLNDLGWHIYIAPLLLLSAGIYLWFRRKNTLLVFGILFFIINLLLVLQIVSFGSTIVSERYTYVPYIGLAFLLASLLDKYSSRVYAGLYWIVPVLVTFIFGTLTFQRTKVWENSSTLWSDVIRHYPNVPEARTNRANYNYKRAIQPAYAKEASFLFQQGLEDCNVALNASNQWEPGFRVRGSILMKMNKFDDAFSDFNRSLQLAPDNDFILNNRGTIYYNNYKKYAEALADFDNAIRLNPNGLYFLNRSRCYYNLGDVEKAKEDVLTAIQKKVEVSEEYRKLLNL